MQGQCGLYIQYGIFHRLIYKKYSCIMPITVHEDCNIKDEGINVVAKEA